MSALDYGTVSPLGDIRIYDEKLNLLCVLPQYISADWRLHHRMWGTVEIHLPKTAQIVSVLTGERRLFLSQGDLQCVVTGCQIEKDCTIFARTCDWLLTKFILKTYVPDKLKTASEIACKMVQDILPVITLETIGESADETNREDFSITRAVDLHTALLSCLSSQNTGFSFRFDAEKKGFVFSVYTGAERADTVLSEQMKTLHQSVYTKSLLSFAEGGVYYHKVEHRGKWDPIENVPKLSNISKFFGTCYTATKDYENTVLGFAVKEGDIVLCKEEDGTFCVTDTTEAFPVEIPPKSNDIFAWSALLSASNRADAEQELADLEEINMAEGRMRELKFGKDFKEGDIVTVEFSAEDFIYSEKRRINSVHLWDNSSSRGCLPETVSVKKDEVDEQAEVVQDE